MPTPHPLLPGLGVIPPQQILLAPIRTTPYDNAFQSTARHHLGKLANPDLPTKFGTFDIIKRVGEILVFCAMGFGESPVFLCPGIVGKQIDLQLNAMNAQLWKLHQQLALLIEFAKKLRLGASLMAWGGSDSGPVWTPGGQDFQTYPPAELGKYKPPPGSTAEPKEPKSVSLENWMRKAVNQSLMFALLYGRDSSTDMPHLGPMKLDI